MSRYHTRLGYGHTADVEADEFTRILTSQFFDFEEVRCNKPTSYTNGFEYIGVAQSGSSVYDPVWSCVRCTWTNNRKTRMQFRQNISWNNVDQGWN